MNVFTNVWKNPYTYATKKGEICHKIQLSKKTDKKKSKMSCLLSFISIFLTKNLKIVSNYE